ncbi:hypothetical protein EMCG_01868 [[Emmonsia] crescens]|uniref:Uncharacterized protein n=1 Tax=[Emmonsia] crescens TaxID=73230 RepID=A0A0G2J267_9EURO|nr:hypothetical protein EMCG_01868 [Emmonsia crescens UAMH 3008]
MWLFRGAQSAVFYYAACTPCAASIHRRKRKKDAAKTHREPPPTVTSNNDNDIVTDQPPVVFQQPFPFSTNTYWEEEIALGPGPPARRAGRRNNINNNHNRKNNNNNNNKKKKKKKTNTNSHASHTSGSQGPSIESPVVAGAAQPESPESTLQNGMGALASTMTGVLEDLVPSRKELGDRWNRIRYQREDEVLWGGSSSPASGAGGPGGAVKGSSVGLSGRGRADTGGSAKYYVAKNPAVNDLHPPVVCGPVSRAETRWMLQPPPSAKVMAGKVRSTASVSVRGDGRHGSFERATVSGGGGDGVGNGLGDEVEGGVVSGSSRRGRRQQQQMQMQSQGDGQLDGCSFTHAERQELAGKNSLQSRRRRGKPPPILVGADNFLALSPSSVDDIVLLSPRPVFAPITDSTDPAAARPQRHHHHHHVPHHHHHHNTEKTHNANTSSDKPPSTPASWQWPWQPTEDSAQAQSRPTSKATADSGKAFAAQHHHQQDHQHQHKHQHKHQQEKLHPAWPSSTLDVAMKHHELVRSVQVEVSSPETAYFYDIDDEDDDDHDNDYDDDYDSFGEKRGMYGGVRPWRWSMDI